MFGTSYVGFGSHPTYTQKIMKIPDIAWPTFFDSYRESMLNIMVSMSLFAKDNNSNIKLLFKCLIGNLLIILYQLTKFEALSCYIFEIS